MKYQNYYFCFEFNVMMMSIDEILVKKSLSKEDVIRLLKSDVVGRNKLYARAAAVKDEFVGSKVFYRGLIEMSNICAKNCLYCGIRKDNDKVARYNLNDKEVLDAVKFSYENHYGSVVLQAGELTGKAFADRITHLLNEINKIGHGEIGVTLSLGEQSVHVYKAWRDAGASRYLLRIESSNKTLFSKIHPQNSLHRFEDRVKALYDLKSLDYQIGTGVMVGLPGQTIDNLADDLFFMKMLDIDMCGLGPYIEHPDTPLFHEAENLLPLEERFNLTLKMIALLRVMMKDINIAASTALQAIDKMGREKGLKVGANILMPNVTPGAYRDQYQLYADKPCVDDAAEDCKNCLEVRVGIAGGTIGYGLRGDSLHYFNRTGKTNSED